MKKSGLIGLKLNPIIYFIILLGLIVVSDSLLNAENTEADNYFQQCPEVTHLSNKSIEVRWNYFPDTDETTHYQVMLNHSYYGHSTQNRKQICKYLTPASDIEVRVVTFHKGEFRGISSVTQILMRTEPPDFTVTDIATASFSILWSGVQTATSYKVYNDTKLIGSKNESGTGVPLNGN